jgi:GNAT superfamily N-acetyltransferase
MALAEVCASGRAEASTGAQLCPAEPGAIRNHLGVLASIPGGHVLVASVDGLLVGVVLARVVGPSAFVDEHVLYVESLYVMPEARRKGVGHALLDGIASLAVDEGAVDIYAVPIPGSRGVQRFLSRLGFAPAATHRYVSTPVLRRRLLADAHSSGRRRGHARAGLDELIARRRRSRAAEEPESVDERRSTDDELVDVSPEAMVDGERLVG